MSKKYHNQPNHWATKVRNKQEPQGRIEGKEEQQKKNNQRTKSVKGIPKVKPGRFFNPREGSKKTSREDEAKSSKIDTKSGGSNGLPFAI